MSRVCGLGPDREELDYNEGRRSQLSRGMINRGSALNSQAKYHVDCAPSSLWYDSTPAQEMLWISEYSMQSKDDLEVRVAAVQGRNPRPPGPANRDSPYRICALWCP